MQRITNTQLPKRGRHNTLSTLQRQSQSQAQAQSIITIHPIDPACFHSSKTQASSYLPRKENRHPLAWDARRTWSSACRRFRSTGRACSVVEGRKDGWMDVLWSRLRNLPNAFVALLGWTFSGTGLRAAEGRAWFDEVCMYLYLYE